MRALIFATLISACSDSPAPPLSTDLAPDDAGTVPSVPLIGDALACGMLAGPGSLEPGVAMTRVDLDPAVYPDALCNDGTPAALFVRPALVPADANRWFVQLIGGGNCRDAQSCAERWCSVGTNFSMRNMSAQFLPMGGTTAVGVNANRVENAWASWNLVMVHYCSSDDWTGTARDVVLDAVDPVSGAPVRFRSHFLGSRILDAVLDLLQKGGSAGLPSLDAAETIVLAGASAGGAGVIHNADRIGTLIKTRTPAVEYRAFIDSSFMPDISKLDWSTTTMCTASGICDLQSYIDREVTSGSNVLWKPVSDDSCASWHAAHDSAGAWKCDDTDHIVRHHVTTPLFIRMGQTDMLLSGDLIDAQFSVPGQGLLTLDLFAAQVRSDAVLVATDIHEELGVPLAPPLYEPPCSRHDTMLSSPDIFSVRVDVAGAPLAMFDIWRNWVSGSGPTVAVAMPGLPFVCP